MSDLYSAAQVAGFSVTQVSGNFASLWVYGWEVSNGYGLLSMINRLEGAGLSYVAHVLENSGSASVIVRMAATSPAT